MAQSFDVCIRGAGIVGRALALLLARERLRVALVTDSDAVSAASSDIRAYALNAVSRNLLQSLRSWPDAAHATPVVGMDVHGDRGGNVHFSSAHQQAEALAWIVDVGALHGVLADAVRFQPQVETTTEPVDAALTIICEGRTSTLRESLGVDFDATPYGQSAIAARVRTAVPHGGVARQWFLPNDGVLALLPLGGPEGDTAALVWSAPQARSVELLALDDAAFDAQLTAAVASDAVGRVSLLGERASWPLQRATANRWSGAFDHSMSARPRSWVLAGDAAHTVHPLAGQGLNLGLADALELAHVLRTRDYWRSVADTRLLRRYERSRKTATLAMGVTTDGLQQLFSQSGDAWQSLRNWGMQGFERAGLLKTWTARQAMGAIAAPGR